MLKIIVLIKKNLLKFSLKIFGRQEGGGLIKLLPWVQERPEQRLTISAIHLRPNKKQIGPEIGVKKL